MKMRIKMSLLLAMVLSSAITALGQKEIVHYDEKNDAFLWYETSAYTNGQSYVGALDKDKKTIIPANKYQYITYDEIKDDNTGRVTGHYFFVSVINSNYTADGIVFTNGTVAYEPNRKYNALSIHSALGGNLLYIYPHNLGVNLKSKELEILTLDPVSGKFKSIIHQTVSEGGAFYHKEGYFAIVDNKGKDAKLKCYDIFGNLLYDGNGYELDCGKNEVSVGHGNTKKVILKTSMAEYNIRKCAEMFDKYKKSNPKAAKEYCKLASFFMKDYNGVLDAEFVTQIGTLYEEGIGVPCNIKKAKELYAKAEKSGYSRAGTLLKQLNDKEKPVVIKGDLPKGVSEGNMMLHVSDEDLLKYAQQGYLLPIRYYCRTSMFFYYTYAFWYNEAEKKGVVNLEELSPITDKVAIEIIGMLEGGATKDASCQFMLACLYSGMQCLGVQNDPDTFSYTDLDKARSYVTKFQSNPNMLEADCFGLSQAAIDWMCDNIKKAR